MPITASQISNPTFSTNRKLKTAPRISFLQFMERWEQQETCTFPADRQAGKNIFPKVDTIFFDLLQAEPPPCGKLLQELLPRVEAELQGAPVDLPEGDCGVAGGHVPPVDHLGLPQPLVRLGQCDLAPV